MSRELYGVKGCEIELHNCLNDNMYNWNYVNEVHVQENTDHNIIIVFSQLCDDDLIKTNIDKMVIKNYCKDVNGNDLIKKFELYGLTKVYSSYSSSCEYPSEFVYAYTDNFKKTKESNIKKEVNEILKRRHECSSVSGVAYQLNRMNQNISELTCTIKDLLTNEDSCISNISSASIKRGDKIIMTVKERTSLHTIDKIFKNICKAFPNNDILIVPDIVKLDIVEENK